VHAVAFTAGLGRQLELVTEPCDRCPSVFRLSPQRWAALDELGVSLGGYRLLVATLVGAFAIATTALAWTLVRRSRDEAMPIVTGYLLVSIAAARWVEDAALISTGWLSPLGRLAAFVNAVALVVIFGLFPDGRWRPRWAALSAGVVAVWCGLVYFSPLATLLVTGSDPVTSVDAVVFLGGLLSIAAAQARRYRGSDDEQRGPIKWVVVALLLAVGVFVPLVVLIRVGVETGPVVDAATVASAIVASFMVVGAIAAAVLRHRLWDVEVVVSRVVVYGGLTLAITIVYVVLVVAGSRLASGWDQPLALGAAIAVGVAVAPVRRRLQHVADRMVYGRPPPEHSLLEPLATLRAADPVTGLARTAEVIGASLHLPYVAIEVAVPDGPPLRAARGDEVRAAGGVELPIRVDGEQVGHLTVVPRRGQNRFGRGDLESLGSSPPRSGPPPRWYARRSRCSGRGHSCSARARRSGGGSAATCTTGSGRAWPGSRTGSSGSGRARGRIRAASSRRSSGSRTASAPRWRPSAASPGTSGPRSWTSWGSSAPSRSGPTSSGSTSRSPDRRPTSCRPPSSWRLTTSRPRPC
jgi:hypothetical protein